METLPSFPPLLQSVYTCLIYTSVLLWMVILWVSWRSRKQVGGLTFVASAVFSIMIAVAFLGISTSTSEDSAIWWVRLKFLGLSMVPGVFIWGGLKLTEQNQPWINYRLQIALLVVPVIVQIALIPDPNSGLFFRSWSLVTLETMSLERQQFTGIGVLFFLYFHSLTAIGTVYFVQFLIQLGEPYRKQFLGLIFGFGLAVVVGTIAAIFPSIFPVPLTPISVFITGLTMMWLILGQRLLDVVPIAYDNILSGMRDAVLIFGRGNLLIECNHQAEVLLNQTRKEVIGKSLQELPFGKDIPENSHLYLLELNFSQRVFQVELSPLKTKQGLNIGKLVILRDITRTRQMERAITDSEEKFRTFFEQSSDGIEILDATGKIIEWNSANEKLTELKREQVIGQYFWDIQLALLPPDKQNELNVDLIKKKVVEISQSQDLVAFNLTLEQDFITSSSTRKHIQQTIFPLQNASGYRTGLITRDITERKKAEQREFQLALERERLSVLRQFIQNASHEFRTPLTNIILSATLLARLEDVQQRQAKARIIEGQSHQIAKLVEMLLKMVNLESQSKLTLSPESLPQILEFVRSKMIKQYGEKPLLLLELSPQMPQVNANFSYLMDAFEQILDNAYRFTPREGKITISAGQGQVVTASTPIIYSDDNMVWVKINNSDAVISQANLPRIFETFWRDDEAHTTPGFGLGLPITRKIIELSDGSIGVESTAEEGTTVWLMLPVAPASSTPLTPVTPEKMMAHALKSVRGV